MTRRPLPLRFEPFIAKLEQASAEGRADFIARNMPRLEEVIAELLADLSAEQRAEVIAELAPTERAAVARLLARGGSSEGGR